VGGLPVILMELDWNNDMVKSYIYANGQLLARHDENEQDRPVYFYLHDRLGSVRQIINSAGNVEQYYTYDPFGEVLEEDGSFDNNFMFTGQWFDDEMKK